MNKALIAFAIFGILLVGGVGYMFYDEVDNPYPERVCNSERFRRPNPGPNECYDHEKIIEEELLVVID